MSENLKCPSCGRVFESDKEEKTITCPYCNGEVSKKQAEKYYSAFYENSLMRKDAHSEDYERLNSLLDCAYDLIKSENYSEAEEKINEALSLTDSDYRVYMALVSIKTKNFTDLSDKTHKRYINKAIEVADEEEKKEITKIYRGYYEKTKLSSKELETVNEGETLKKKRAVEKGLKRLIPTFMTIEKRNKLFAILFPILLVIGPAILLYFTFVLKITVLSFVGMAIFIVGCILFRVWFVSKDRNFAFNSLLDVYDLLDKIEITGDNLSAVYDRFYALFERFEDKDPLYSMSYDAVKFVGELLKTKDENILEFVENNKYLAENIPPEYYE